MVAEVPPLLKKGKGVISHPPKTDDQRPYFFFLGAAFLAAFLVFTFESPLSRHERKSRRGEWVHPPQPRGAYFFFLEPPFLAAFFFAAIVRITPFGPGMDGNPPRQHLR